MKLDNNIIGIATIVNSKKLKISKILGFLKIVNSLGIKKVYKQKINNLKNSFPQIKSSSPYLTRFGVSQNFRGKKNYSSLFIKKILKSEKNKLIAHVNKKNIRAVNFYLKNNFKIIDKEKKFYQIQYKK